MRFSGFLNRQIDRARQTGEKVEDWATAPNPPVWQVVVGAIIVLLLMRVLVVAL